MPSPAFTPGLSAPLVLPLCGAHHPNLLAKRQRPASTFFHYAYPSFRACPTPSLLPRAPLPLPLAPPSTPTACVDRPNPASSAPLSDVAPRPEVAHLPDAKLTFWLAALSEAAAAMLAIMLCSASGLPVLGKGWAVTSSTVLRAVAVAIPFSAVFWAIERAPTGIQTATEASFRAFFAARQVWEVALFCLCVAFGEELLFRSWLLAGLQACDLPAHIALVGSSVVFGALHAYTRVYMVLASLAGLMFGGMFLASGQSVLEPLVVHFLYDFCTILVMQRKWLSVEDE